MKRRTPPLAKWGKPVNPLRDCSGITAMVADKIVKELLGKMIAG